MDEEMSKESYQQLRLNHRMDAIEKARAEAAELGTSLPAAIDELEADLGILLQAMSGKVEASRVWDTGATAGMTKPGTTDGQVRNGSTVQVTTSAGVVRTVQWVCEALARGELDHVGLEATQNRLSSGQHNAELGNGNFVASAKFSRTFERMRHKCSSPSRWRPCGMERRAPDPEDQHHVQDARGCR